MDNVNALALLFPNGVVKHNAYTFEVNGLSEEQTPQNCEILAKGDDNFYRGRKDYQTHYVVKVGGRRVRFRVCKAMQGSGYEAYACGHFINEELDLIGSIEAVQRIGARK